MAATYIQVLRQLEAERKQLQDRALYEPNSLTRCHLNGQAWALSQAQITIRDAFESTQGLSPHERDRLHGMIYNEH